MSKKFFFLTSFVLVLAVYAMMGDAIDRATAAEQDNITVVTPKLELADKNIVDQDDMCIWIHPASPSLSTIIASDKSASRLFVYDLKGETIQEVAVPGTPGNIDIRYNFPLGGEKVGIIGYNDRDNSKICLYKVDPKTRRIAKVDNGAIDTGPNYGLSLYHSPKSRKFYAFTVAEDSGVGPEQHELSDDGAGKIQGKKVRAWSLGHSEGCVADDETGQLYIGEENVGIWKYDAEPNDSTEGKMIARIGENGFTADVEGLAIYYMPDGAGYLLASSQGNDTFKVFDRKPPHTYVKTFSVETAGDTDGIDVTNVNLGPEFPQGIFTLHNGVTSPHPVLVCAFEDLGLNVDVDYWNPRGLSYRAEEPNPAYGATAVELDVVLNWTAGIKAASHNVYFSDNKQAVIDGTAPVATVTDTSYGPLSLDLGRTYYWRVDEVNGPPDFTVHQGDIWSFTTELLAYPVENITATASSASQAEKGPENTINGSGMDDNDLHSNKETAMWLSSAEPLGAWIEYEFDMVYKLHQMWVWNSNQTVESLLGFGFKDVAIEYSTNGTDYTTLGTTHEFARAPGTAGYAHNTTIDFGGAAAKYVRLTAASNWGGIMPQYGLGEVRFFCIPVHARNPYPDSEATDVDVDVVLSWRAGREAASHNVYFSADEQAVIDETISPVSIPAIGSYANYDAGELELDQTYYWKVNEINDAETPTSWEGDLWDFTTNDFVVVDDFESYTDFEPHRIFDTWIDGLGVPTNGSHVGYAEPPFAEQTIVHSGSQSMPLFYDNTGVVTYSEAERTFDPAQNWTQAGAATLVLYFHGTEGNTGQLYVNVNGTKVAYDGNPGNLVLPSWQVWNIDLASLGAGLQNITKLSIGIDGNGASGTLYLDDIRLYRLAP